MFCLVVLMSRRRILIFGKVRVTARCLEQQAYDKNGVPDKSGNNDHQNDATGYPIAYEMPIVKPVINIPVYFPL